MDQKFLICEHCGNIVAAVKESGVPVVCCGQKMKEIIPGTVEASREKHIPEFVVEGNKVLVTVGSGARLALNDKSTPVDAVVGGIID